MGRTKKIAYGGTHLGGLQPVWILTILYPSEVLDPRDATRCTRRPCHVGPPAGAAVRPARSSGYRVSPIGRETEFQFGIGRGTHIVYDRTTEGTGLGAGTPTRQDTVSVSEPGLSDRPSTETPPRTPPPQRPRGS